MKILVVYGGAHNGLKKELLNTLNLIQDQTSKVTNVKNLTTDIQFYINCVNDIMRKQNVAAVDEIEVISRHMSDLKDYIYEPEDIDASKILVHDVKQLFTPVLDKDQFKDENSAKRFDYLDFVIVDVPGTVLPWMQKSLPLTKLFYQCKITNKPLFCAGAGMAQIAYFCAMESKTLSIINGLEKGGSMKNIKSFVKPDVLDKLTQNYHCYMDNLSGDVFSYNKDKCEWFPLGNTGLHDSRAEASIQGGTIGGAGDSLKKKRVHVSNASGALKPLLIMTSNSDTKCELRKNFMSHWILKGLQYQFVVENINTWDPHTVSIVHPETVEKTYTTLAEGERGPQIAEHKNSILTQFPIKSKHHQTIQILTNFIEQWLQKVSSVGKVGTQLFDA